ncbi:MAG: cell division protein FtsQ/DivIB [Candidatus Paceibacteria bacterium]
MKKRPVKSNNRLVTTKKRRRTIDPATRQLVLQIIGGVALFGLVSLMLTGVWYGSRISALTLETITVEGGQTISHSQVSEAVASTLTGNYFGLVPKRFAWTYPQEAVVAAVADISRVKNPVVERISGTQLRVTVDEYIPYALWCTEEENQQCYFIDREGIAFASAPVLEGGSMYRFYSLGDKPAINGTLYDRQTLSKIVVIAEALESKFNLPVNQIELDMVGDVFFRVVGGGEIKATTAQSASKIIENLSLILSADEFKTLAAGTFLYIDLRFGNKVFVNDAVPSLASSAKEDDISRTAGNEAVNILTATEENDMAISITGEIEDVIDAGDRLVELESEVSLMSATSLSSSTDDVDDGE